MFQNRINIVNIFLTLSLLSLHSCKEDLEQPILTTLKVTDISYTSGNSGGHISNKGTTTIITRGVCWNTTGSPTIDDSKTKEEGEIISFICGLSQLLPNTKYYVRAYATASTETWYGNEVSFITKQIEIPVLITSDILFTKYSVISGGTISSDGGGTIVERGVCWSTNSNPTILDSKTNDGGGVGSFTSKLTCLMYNNKYNIRAYAVNSAGTGYGQNVQFRNLYDLFPLNVGNEYIYVYSYSYTKSPSFWEGKRSIGKMKWTIISSIIDNNKVEYKFEEKFNGIDIIPHSFTSALNDTFQIIDRIRVFKITADTSKVITMSNITTNWLGTSPWDFTVTRYQNTPKQVLNFGYEPKREFRFSADSGMIYYWFKKGPNSNMTTETMKLESLRIVN